MGKVDVPTLFILQLLQAAPRAAIAQALPFRLRHLLQGLGLPKRSLLIRGRLRRCGHESLGSRNQMDVGNESVDAPQCSKVASPHKDGELAVGYKPRRVR